MLTYFRLRNVRHTELDLFSPQKKTFVRLQIRLPALFGALSTIQTHFPLRSHVVGNPQNGGKENQSWCANTECVRGM